MTRQITRSGRTRATAAGIAAATALALTLIAPSPAVAGPGANCTTVYPDNACSFRAWAGDHVVCTFGMVGSTVWADYVPYGGAAISVFAAYGTDPGFYFYTVPSNAPGFGDFRAYTAYPNGVASCFNRG